MTVLVGWGLDDQENGTATAARKVGSPTVIDITRKLELLCELFELTRSELKRYFEKAKIDPRTVDSWFGNPTVIRGPCRDAIVHYFQTVKGLPFNHKAFTMPYADFEARVRSWNVESGHGRLIFDHPAVQNQVVISLADAASRLSGSEKTYICGKYKTFRLSASDTSKVVTEVISIKSRPDTECVCDVTMYCNKVDGDGNEEDTSVEVFIGSMFKFGQTYMIIISYFNGLDDRRPRTIQFPVVPTLRRDVHFGIITGYSVFRADHFSGRILARKISPDPVLIPDDRKGVRRINATDTDVVRHAALLQTDPNHEGEKLMTVDKKEMVAFVRYSNGNRPT